MSSLTESTIAMPMGSSKGRMRDRQSTRDSIQIILEKSQTAYLSALALSAGSGKVEEVRSACLSLALLRAFQSSLGQGSETVTAAAAEILGELGFSQRSLSSRMQLQRPLSRFTENCSRTSNTSFNPT